MESLKINDVLQLREDEVDRAVAKLNIANVDGPALDQWIANSETIDTAWLLWHFKRRYYSVGELALCFIRITTDTWLFTCGKRITAVLPVDLSIHEHGNIGYEADHLKFEFEGKDLDGRLVVRFHNRSRTIGQRYSKIKDDIEVITILDEKYTGKITW